MTKLFSICFMLFFMATVVHAYDVSPIEIDGEGGGYDFRPFKLLKVLNENEVNSLEILYDLFEFQEKEKNLFGETRLKIKDKVLEDTVPSLLKLIASPLCFVPISEKTYYSLDEAHYVKGDETEYFTYSFKSRRLNKKFEIDMCLYSIRGYCYASFSKEAIDLSRDFMINLEESDLNGIGELPVFIEKKMHWAKILQKSEKLSEYRVFKTKSNDNLTNLKKLNNNRKFLI